MLSEYRIMSLKNPDRTSDQYHSLTSDFSKKKGKNRNTAPVEPKESLASGRRTGV